MRPINLSKDAAKFLQKCEAKYAKQLALRIKGLSAQEHAHDTKPLKGKLTGYRIDVGDFRIIYRYDNDELYIVLVGKRNDDEVYKLMNRKVAK